LNNCDDWSKKVKGLPNVFTVSCSVIRDDNETDVNQSITGQEQTGLHVEKSAETVGNGWTGGMTAGVVVGFLIAVVILVFIAWWYEAQV
jgi:hypothetical protein